MLTCLDSMLKYLVFLSTLFFMFSGVAIIVVASYLEIQLDNYLDFLANDYVNTSFFLILLGTFIVVVAFLGCCGAVTENFCMMCTFSLILFGVLILEITVIIVAFALKDNTNQVLKDSMVKGMSHYNESTGVTKTWDYLQHHLKCCGTDNYTDWRTTPFAGKGDDVPDSCCMAYSVGCGEGAAAEEDNGKAVLHSSGCFAELSLHFQDNVCTVGGGLLLIAFLHFLSMFVACYLGGRMKKKYYYT